MTAAHAPVFRLLGGGEAILSFFAPMGDTLHRWREILCEVDLQISHRRYCLCVVYTVSYTHLTLPTIYSV